MASTPLTASSNAPSCRWCVRREVVEEDQVTRLGDIFYNDGLKPVAMGLEDRAQVRALAFRADSAAHGKTLLEKGLHDPRSDVAIRAGDKDLSGRDSGHAGELR